ncbi:SoxR reducing system RseC family protein [Halomonas sp. M20]|uniref:SoxR reducing system RseC family protein n=1 Tax=Halomonas sp. M20 TaxID=2763264 RepID=UPI001D0B308A|nr:SoxR reducing system RseC family protein [Halomonas sp. M20]
MNEQGSIKPPAAQWLEERGVVVALFAGGAWVEARSLSGCNGCAKTGCGTGLLTRRRSSRLALYTDAGLCIGNRVRMGISPKSFLQGALIVYGLPLLTAVLAGGLAETLLSPGPLAVPFMFAGGLLGGCLLSRHQLQRHHRRYQPILLAVESE